MLTNYLKLAIRNLVKNRLYSLLNICGLTIGVAGCMLILLFVAHEMSYDQWNPVANRIVRPTYEIKIDGFGENHGSVDAILGPEAAAALPEIEAWCRIRNMGTITIKRDAQSKEGNREEKVLKVDSSFFKLFPLNILAGDPGRCLSEPGMAVISRSSADYYFASPEAALGQILVLGQSGQQQQVSAVFEDFPENVHFHADVLLPLAGDEEIKKASPYWGFQNNFFTYFLLQKNIDKAVFAKKFETLAANKISILLKDLFGTTTPEFEKSGKRARFELQNLTDIHLYSAKQSELQANGNIRYVWVLSAIAAFILLIACINFMNLATARASRRAREVGVRKALGSSRMALAGQFLTESLTLATLAMGLAVGVAVMALPAFSELAGRNLSIPWSNPVFGFSLLGGTLIVGLLAGSYPAFFLSAFKTINTLKGTSGHNAGMNRAHFRNGLVVFQFVISTVLIFSTILVYSQLRFMQQKNLGFEKSQVLIIDNANALGERGGVLAAAMRQNPHVESVTRTNYLPMPNRYRENALLSTKRATGASDKVLQRWRVDAEYIRTMSMAIKLGRDFDPARLTDSSAIILNETAAKELGFADPIGQVVFTSKSKAVDSKAEDFEALTIIGVVQDFNFESLHEKVGGLFLQLGPANGPICLRIKGMDATTVIAGLEQKWQSLTPDQSLSYLFMDETLNRMYATEQNTGVIALIFALLSVLVSCLGLFGLATFTAEQRTKEIGIRKVLGASVANITGMLNIGFLKLVLIAVVLSAPVAYYFMEKWLVNFVYRIEIQWWMFLGTGLLAIVLAFFTVTFQSIRAALANPVTSLRNE